MIRRCQKRLGLQQQFREEVKLTKGRVLVRGKIATRIENPAAVNGPKRADYVFYGLPNLPLAVLEAKRNIFEIALGMQQALAYAEMLDAPFAISANGDGFLINDRTGISQPVSWEVEHFPSYDELCAIYKQWKNLSQPEKLSLTAQPYHVASTDKEAHYYQKVAINRTIHAIGQPRHQESKRPRRRDPRPRQAAHEIQSSPRPD